MVFFKIFRLILGADTTAKKGYTLFFLWEQFYKNIEAEIEAQICSEIFPKTTKFDHENFFDESLDQEKHFKHVFEVGVGWEFEKILIKFKNIRGSVGIYWFLQKRVYIRTSTIF